MISIIYSLYILNVGHHNIFIETIDKWQSYIDTHVAIIQYNNNNFY